MLSTLAAIVAEARQCSVPVLAIMYPRGETTDGHDNNYEALRVDEPDKYTDMVAHAVRIASDLGASMIKTQYTGSTDTFRRVVRAAAPTPVVIAGGPATAVTTALTLAAESIAAGAAGVSFGRNVFGRTDPAPVIRALRAIVHDGLSPTDAATHVELQ
jgi:DhnA family fructose-bisphosphate aldolase class Ia